MSMNSSEPLYVCSQRRLIASFLSCSLALATIFGLIAFPNPAIAIWNVATFLMLLFGTVSVMFAFILLVSRKFTFYADWIALEEGFHSFFRIRYNEISDCKVVHTDPSLFAGLVTQTGLHRNSDSVLELRVIFRKEALVVRGNPEIPDLRLDLYSYIHRKMRERNVTKIAVV